VSFWFEVILEWFDSSTFDKENSRKTRVKGRLDSFVENTRKIHKPYLNGTIHARWIPYIN
jgi:hypothetical protein